MRQRLLSTVNGGVCECIYCVCVRYCILIMPGASVCVGVRGSRMERGILLYTLAPWLEVWNECQCVWPFPDSHC